MRDALIRLNPEIAAQSDRADEVLYKLRAIVLSVRSDGLIRASEEMMAWIKGERSMPFGQNNEHVPVQLIDFAGVGTELDQNQYVVTQQFTFRAGSAERRADLMLVVNGLPLVLIEAKTPTRSAVSWVDGALQVHDDYEKFVPELFVCNVFSVERIRRVCEDIVQHFHSKVDRFESGVLNSVEFLKQLLQLAKEVLQAEKEVPPEEDEDRGKAALTDLFNEVKTAETPIMVERVVADIDEIVRLVRFPGWQDTLAGEREIKKALRKSLFKYKLHADEELFEKAYSYIRQYY